MKRICQLALVSLLGSVVLSGCYRWKEIDTSRVARYDSIRVTLEYSEELEIYGPTVDGDTLRGYTEWTPRTTENSIAVPVAKIREIKGYEKQSSAPYLKGLVIVAGVAAVAWFIIVNYLVPKT